jgi:hypothetical protein
MFIVLTEILVIVHCLRLKTAQCFRVWLSPPLQANQEKARTYLGGPVKLASLSPCDFGMCSRHPWSGD